MDEKRRAMNRVACFSAAGVGSTLLLGALATMADDAETMAKAPPAHQWASSPRGSRPGGLGGARAGRSNVPGVWDARHLDLLRNSD